MWYLVLILLIIHHLTTQLILKSLGSLEIFIVQSIMYAAIALFIYILSQQSSINILHFKRYRHWYLGKTPLQAGLIIGGFQVALLIIIGLFAGFGGSPYSFTPRGITLNLFYVGSMAISLELARSYLINTTQARFKSLTLILIGSTLFFVFLSVGPLKLISIDPSQPVETLEFLGNTLITSISMNLLAGYLAYLGGTTASLAYMGTILGFQWFSPILPDPHWTLQALIGTIAPAIGFIILDESFETPNQHRLNRRQQRKKYNQGNWTTMAIFALLIVFFSFGYLGVQPTVIYSGSMQPTYEIGDIVIIDEVNPETLQVGDIIQYFETRDNKTKIIHRIVNIVYEDGTKYFTTQGDANTAPDVPSITGQRIIGKPIFTIPKLGWVQILVRNSLPSI